MPKFKIIYHKVDVYEQEIEADNISEATERAFRRVQDKKVDTVHDFVSLAYARAVDDTESADEQ